jgi:hypothetical protein
MPTQFDINPNGGVFRSAISGQDAVSPASPQDIVFDAFGPKLQGVTISGTVAYSSFTGPTSYTVPGSSATCNYYSYQIKFPETLDYVPIVLCSYESGGTWSDSFSSGSVTFTNSGGILIPSGGGGTTAGFVATTSYLLLYLQRVNFAGGSYTTPDNYAYRLFGV